MKQRGDFRAIKKERPLRTLQMFEDLVTLFVYYVFYLSDRHSDFLTQRFKADTVKKSAFQDIAVLLIKTIFVNERFKF